MPIKVVMSYSGTMRTKRLEYDEVITMLIISVDDAWEYLKQGITVFYRWEMSEDWYELNDETVNGVVTLLERDDYEFGIESQE